MAKDPAFLFYPGDYLRDTQCLSEKAQVAYDRIMCEHIRNQIITEQQLRFFTKRLSEDEKEELLMTLTKTGDGYQISWVVDSFKKRQAFTESRRQSRLQSDEDQVRVYIVRDNVRSTYKIGSSVNPLRRYNELSNQKSPAIMADTQNERDLSLIWYSDFVSRSEEKKLHKKFKSKNLYGEWFSLSEDDLKYIFDLYKGTTYDTTYDTHTVNEIENEDVNEYEEEDVNTDEKIKNNNNMSSIKDTENIPLPFEGSEFASIWAEWLQNRKEARIKNYTPTGLKRLFKWLKETSGEDEKIAILIIDQSLTKGWQGLFELKTLPNAANSTNTAPGDKAGKLSRERIQAAKNF
jgi:predicted GIY-YIG superfamily endonuclease